MRTTAAVLTCCLLVAVLAGAAAAAGTPSTAPATSDRSTASVASFTAPAASDPSTALTAVQSADTTNYTSPESIGISIQSDGDARFVLSKEFPTATANQSAAFDRLASEFESGQHGRLGYGTYESVVDGVGARTNRDMELVDDGPRTRRSDGVGYLDYQFTWTNFANGNETNVTVGDAFDAGDERWLGGLSDGQRLTIQAPAGYSVTESPSGPEIEDDTLVWTGPATFGTGDLRATFEQNSSESTAPTTLLFGLVVFLIVGTFLVVGWQVASDGADGDSIGDLGDRLRHHWETVTDGTDASGSDDAPGTDESDSSGPRPGAGDGTTAVTDVGPSPAANTEGENAAEQAVDPELLSDVERVRHLLERNGGRMKQANIVTETGWSNAKVSQLLSRMDEEEQIDKLRIGRENLITLPDVDVTDRE